MRRTAGGGQPGKARRRWASGELATTTRGEMKADVTGVQEMMNMSQEHEIIVMNSILK